MSTYPDGNPPDGVSTEKLSTPLTPVFAETTEMIILVRHHSEHQYLGPLEHMGPNKLQLGISLPSKHG